MIRVTPDDDAFWEAEYSEEDKFVRRPTHWLSREQRESSIAEANLRLYLEKHHATTN